MEVDLPPALTGKPTLTGDKRLLLGISDTVWLFEYDLASG